MTREEAIKKMQEDGLTYGDSVMLVASVIPEGESKVWDDLTQEQVKEWMLKRLEYYREKLGTPNFNLRSNLYRWRFGIQILQEFG